MIASISSRLAVAVDARDGDDLARADLQRDAVDGRQAAVVVDAQVLDLEQRLAGVPGVLLDAQHDVAADHHAWRASASSAPAVSIVPIVLPRRSTVTRSATSSTSMQLVGDEDDRRALVAQRRAGLGELGGLLRR